MAVDVDVFLSLLCLTSFWLHPLSSWDPFGPCSIYYCYRFHQRTHVIQAQRQGLRSHDHFANGLLSDSILGCFGLWRSKEYYLGHSFSFCM